MRGEITLLGSICKGLEIFQDTATEDGHGVGSACGEALKGDFSGEIRAGGIELQGTAHALSLRQVEAIVLAMISEAGTEATVGRHIDRKDTTALMGGADAQAVGTSRDAHGTLDVDLLTFFVVHLKGHAATGAGHEMAALGIEVHQEVFLEFLLDAGLRAADDVFLRIVACGIGTLIDRHHTAVDRSELTEEVAGHLLVIEVFAILATVVMFRHTEIEHPTGVGAELIIAGIERILQSKVSVAVAVGRDDDVLTLHDKTIWREQFDIKDMAHVGVAEIVGPHHVGLVPDGIALVIAIVVEVEVDFLLNGSVFKQRADAVEAGLGERRKKEERGERYEVRDER